MPALPDWIALLALAAAAAFALLWLTGLRRASGDAASLSAAQGACRIAEGRCAEAVTRAEVAESRCATQGERIAELGEDLSTLRAEARAERDALAARMEAQRRDWDEARDAAQAELRRLTAEHESHKREAEARAEGMAAQITELKALRQEMTDRFRSLADETLQLHGDNFTKANDEKLRALLGPMKEHIGRFQDELRQTNESATRERERLNTEIRMLTARSEQISQEAVALTNALKGEKQRQGAWGEMILERVLEDSGLERGREYETQFAVVSEEGQRRRPDVVIRLPGDKVVVVDAKVSLVAYEEAVNAETAEERERQLRAHVAAVKTHIDDLSRRDYAALVDGSVDYVLMFMPVEGALAAALGVQGDLTSYAMARRVGIATPTTLMLALRTIQHVWAVERRESNAEAIADRAGKLFDKMAGVVEAFDKVGDHLSRAQSEHATAMDRLSRGGGNVLGQFDKLRRLGARSSKAIPVGFDGEDDEEGDLARIEAAE